MTPLPPQIRKWLLPSKKLKKWGGGQFLCEQSPGLALHNTYHFILLKGGGGGGAKINVQAEAFNTINMIDSICIMQLVSPCEWPSLDLCS